jgi:aryl-alcohol dehydrogenase-like predicted oxidoreductase
MKFTTLGSSGIKIPSVTLGTMTWGQQNTESEAHTQMDYALDRGINFFDTAELYSVPPEPRLYGRTEEIIGTWFAKRKKRDDIILASKIAGGGLPYARGGSALNRVQILEAVDESLKRL